MRMILKNIFIKMEFKEFKDNIFYEADQKPLFIRDVNYRNTLIHTSMLILNKIILELIDPNIFEKSYVIYIATQYNKKIDDISNTLDLELNERINLQIHYSDFINYMLEQAESYEFFESCSNIISFKKELWKIYCDDIENIPPELFD